MIFLRVFFWQDGIFHEDVYEEKQVIEPEVLEHLPSVRRLAEFYKRESVSPEAHVDNQVVSCFYIRKF